MTVSSPEHIAANAKQSARKAGLHYLLDDTPGFERRRWNKGFRYFKPNHKFLKNAADLRRIRDLVIPPAWKNVWICPDPNGHIQATGRDARGRKQYLYHPDWKESRDQDKFDRMRAFGKTLPKVRREIQNQLRQPGLSRKKVLAAVTRLLELSATRVGNEEYAVQNKSYGLTTLRNRHATVNGSKICFRFRGKSGKEHNMAIEHPSLAKIVRKCQHLPGQKLFQYVDEEGVHDVKSEDVNDYIAGIAGNDFTAKDFRTWKGSVLMMAILSRVSREKSRNKVVSKAVEEVARHLGNTPAICRKCYIHPAIINGYLTGAVIPVPGRSRNGLYQSEAAFMRILSRSQKQPSLVSKLNESISKKVRKKVRRSGNTNLRNTFK